MSQTVIQRAFAPLKRGLPGWASRPIRKVVTAFVGPIWAAHRTGYFRSAFKMAAVSKNGQPIPWYTYPSIQFLKHRSYSDKHVLEFGGGQSTLWWASRAARVVTIEGDRDWYDKIKGSMPDNVELFYVSTEDVKRSVLQVTQVLEDRPFTKYDVIVIDGLHRFELIPIALNYVKDDGIVVCDNAEGYGFCEGFKESGLSRVDFFGNAPGVVLPHATSIYFSPSSCFVFDGKVPIPIIAEDS